MGEWGIKNYQPQWTESLIDLSELISQISFIPSPIISCWSLWDMEDDQWFCDAPLVICTPNHQLEFCATQLSKFSFSVNSVDLDAPVNWCGDEGIDDALPLRWVKNKNPEFKNLAKKEIIDIEIIESCVEENIQAFVGLELLILSGIALHFQDDCLAILNGLDCNCLFRKPLVDEKLKFTSVSEILHRSHVELKYDLG